jgi:alkylation response protein AidB-like acyl-CoA dehydrogenase
MDFRLSERAEAFREEVRDFLDSTVTPDMEERIHRSGTAYDRELQERLVERGWYALDWPTELGGPGGDPLEALVLGEELQRIGIPMDAITTTLMIAKIIALVGSEVLTSQVLPRVRGGESMLCLGFTEPHAGSDVAAVQTRATRDGDEWVINGQKMFTSFAHVSDYVFLLARTTQDGPKHHGLTTFLVPLDQPGIEIQPVHTLAGDRTNITFYNDARVPDSHRIGEVDGGWKVMVLSLQLEHSGGWASLTAALVDKVEAWARDTTDADGRPRIDDADVRRRLARAATDAEVGQLLQWRAAWMSEIGTVPEAEGPMSKLFTSEALTRATESLHELVGADGLRTGRIEHALRFAVATTIYGGTSEIQRNIIATRGLGLPR